ncbi:hypothetical protein R1CP_36435 (plasmid) [Rhodococcus opacus]|uniref:NAD(P)-dependent oxidoreductase n=1 Tax=Rhodococcus opacus TaxID=37919 RepID=A0A1B1KGZ3_RHOOP|nr:NAD(P)-binding domain-containing protein [Rhodococcus opacus]ANS31893.1 hypothetical protein R1CP_36435 [Rhodococcus opacus]
MTKEQPSMGNTTPSHDVTVIGLGAMGGELARVLVAAGKKVIVWNRSPDKAESLAKAGADVALTPAEAIAASPITLFCVWDYSAANEILAQDGVGEAVAGKVIAQLSNGSAEEATHQANWLEQRDAEFLGGGIMGYPRAVGAPDTIILYSGDPDVFKAHAAVLRILAPAQQHVGNLSGDAATVYTAVWGFYFAAMGGLFDGLALIAACGLSRESVKAMVAPMAGKFVEGALDVFARLDSDNFTGDQATVAGHIEGIEATCAGIRKKGVEPRMLDAFVAQLRVATVAGRGDEDVAAVAESLMPASMLPSHSGY